MSDKTDKRRLQLVVLPFKLQLLFLRHRRIRAQLQVIYFTYPVPPHMLLIITESRPFFHHSVGVLKDSLTEHLIGYTPVQQQNAIAHNLQHLAYAGHLDIHRPSGTKLAIRPCICRQQRQQLRIFWQEQHGSICSCFYYSPKTPA